MITIIICSRTKKISLDLEKNIKDTIGVDFELIVIDNSTNAHTIFTAYNEGVARAKGEILCFMHEDIMYHTKNWGKMVVDAFENDKVGCLGVIGGHCFHGNIAAWWPGNVNSGEVIQGYEENGIYKTMIRKDYNFYHNQKTIEVATVDGLWMCLPKEIFNRVKWDSDTFNGFHCYDADICMQVRKCNKEVHVLYDCFIEHKSYGCLNEMFWKNSALFLKKWQSSFPLIVLNEHADKEAIMDIASKYQKRINVANAYEEKYYSVLNSNAFKIGNLILKPLYFLKSIFR